MALNSRQRNFVDRAYAAARAAGLSGPQADLAVSQAIHETAWGRSPSGTNNYHGIKGRGTSRKTWEVVNGQRVNTRASFADYPSMTGSFRAWKSLMDRKYPEVMKAKTLPQAVKGLNIGVAGKPSYATDPNYESKVLSVSRLAKGVRSDVPRFVADAPRPTARPNSPMERSLLADASRATMREGGLLGLDGRAPQPTLASASSPVQAGLLSYAPEPQQAMPNPINDAGLLGTPTRSPVGTPGDMNSLARATPGNAAGWAPPVEATGDFLTGDIPDQVQTLPGFGPMQVPEVMQPAPQLPPPTTIQDRPVYQEPQQAPQSAPQTPSGMQAISGLFGAPEGAMAISQSNPDISFASLGNGRVQKTNQYGHQSILDAGDYSHPGIPGPKQDYGVPEIQVPDQPQQPGFLGIPEARSRMGQTVRGGLGGAAGAAVGGLLGPVGAILGGLVAREIAQGRNPLDAFNRQTSAFGPNGFAQADPNQNYFPSAPAQPAGFGGGSGPSYNEMRSYSPRAADAISGGRAGLF